MNFLQEEKKVIGQLGSNGLRIKPGIELKAEILRLKQEKNAVILSHFYQIPEIQNIADHVADSLELARRAAQTDADLIVFAGVNFMAETAKILNPEKKVVVPDLEAGCSLADSCTKKLFRKFIDLHPDHIVVTYINCNANIKAMSDIICTSSNAVDIIRSIPEDQPIIFAPDENLGKYLIKETGRDLLLWNGTCVVHEAFSIDKLLRLHKKHPGAKIIAHPESQSHILKVASFVGSTSKLLNYVKEDPNKEFIVATEAGVIHQMQKEAPEKLILPAPAYEENLCACSECEFMKLNTFEKLYLCMETEKPEIEIDEELRKKAYIPIKRMLEF